MLPTDGRKGGYFLLRPESTLAHADQLLFDDRDALTEEGNVLMATAQEDGEILGYVASSGRLPSEENVPCRVRALLAIAARSRPSARSHDHRRRAGHRRSHHKTIHLPVICDILAILPASVRRRLQGHYRARRIAHHPARGLATRRSSMPRSSQTGGRRPRLSPARRRPPSTGRLSAFEGAAAGPLTAQPTGREMDGSRGTGQSRNRRMTDQ